MRKGIISVLIATLICSVMVPFSSAFADENYNSGVIGSYLFWGMYNFNTMKGESYTNTSHVIQVPYSYFSVENTTGEFSGFRCQHYPGSDSYVCVLCNPNGNTNESGSMHIEGNPITMTEGSYSTIREGSAFGYLTTESLFPSYTAFSWNNYVELYPASSGGAHSGVYYLSFWINTPTGDPTIYALENYSNDVDYHIVRYTYMAGWYLYTVEITPSERTYVTIDYPTLKDKTDVRIVPIFYGESNLLTDDLRSYIGLGSLLETGNKKSLSATQNISSASQNFSSAAEDINTLESGFVSNSSSALQDLNLNTNIVSSDKFINGASFVKTCFDSLITPTPFGSYILFALSLGVALIFIGRFKE